jgi:chorismate mutase
MIANTSATDDVSADTGIDHLRTVIDDLDHEILRLVRQRSEVSQQIGAARLAAGGTKIVYNREMAVLRHYGQLGQEGRELALLLLRLGRGQLGR